MSSNWKKILREDHIGSLIWGPGGAPDLNDIEDVTIASPATRDILSYSAGIWYNKSKADLEIISYDDTAYFTGGDVIATGAFEDLISSEDGIALTIANDAVDADKILDNCVSKIHLATSLISDLDALTTLADADVIMAQAAAGGLKRITAANLAADLVTKRIADTGGTSTTKLWSNSKTEAELALKLDAAGGTISGDLTVSGNLQIDGTQTIFNTAIIEVEDLNFLLGKGNTTPAGADGAGLTVESGTTYKPGFFWKESGFLSGWTLRGEGLFDMAGYELAPIAVMHFRNGLPVASELFYGQGAFYFDTVNEELYVRVDNVTS